MNSICTLHCATDKDNSRFTIIAYNVPSNEGFSLATMYSLAPLKIMRHKRIQFESNYF